MTNRVYFYIIKKLWIRFIGDIGNAGMAQLVEHILGKDEVTGSIPVPSLIKKEEQKMREIVILACQKCKQRNYTVRKNKKTMTEKIELKKYCKFCRATTVHKEIK